MRVVDPGGAVTIKRIVRRFRRYSKHRNLAHAILRSVLGERRCRVTGSALRSHARAFFLGHGPECLARNADRRVEGCDFSFFFRKVFTLAKEENSNVSREREREKRATTFRKGDERGGRSSSNCALYKAIYAAVAFTCTHS